jgi:hypothetical protein
MNREQKLLFWRKHITAWQQSRLSQAEYVRQHRLSPQSFKYYRRFLLPPPDAPVSQIFMPVVVQDTPVTTPSEDTGSYGFSSVAG